MGGNLPGKTDSGLALVSEKLGAVQLLGAALILGGACLGELKIKIGARR